MIPDDPPHDYASLMRLERTRLLALIRSLADADWWSATPCPGWTVLDLVNHLVGIDLAVISRQRDQHHGTPAPDGLDERAFIGWLDDLQNGWVVGRPPDRGERVPMSGPPSMRVPVGAGGPRRGRGRRGRWG